MLDIPKQAVVGLTIVNNNAGPAIPDAMANPVACVGVIALRTRGLVRVLAICASKGTSWI